MIWKSVFVVSIISIQFVFVESDTTDIIKSVGDFVNDFLISNSDNTEEYELNSYNGTDDVIIEELDDGGNKSISAFNVKDIKKSITNILSDVTEFIREGIGGSVKIKSESEVFKTGDNKTKVHVKILELHEVPKNTSTDKKIVLIKSSEAPVIGGNEENDSDSVLEIATTDNTLQSDTKSNLTAIIDGETVVKHVDKSTESEEINSTKTYEELFDLSVPEAKINEETDLKHNVSDSVTVDTKLNVLNYTRVFPTDCSHSETKASQNLTTKLNAGENANNTENKGKENKVIDSKPSGSLVNENKRQGKISVDTGAPNKTVLYEDLFDLSGEPLTTENTSKVHVTGKVNTMTVAVDNKNNLKTSTSKPVSNSHKNTTKPIPSKNIKPSTTVKPLTVPNVNTAPVVTEKNNQLISTSPSPSNGTHINATTVVTDKIVEQLLTTVPDVHVATTINPLTIPFTKSDVIQKINELEESIKSNEILDTYYDSDNSTDYPGIDYLELYKDTTNEEQVYDNTELNEVKTVEIKTESDNIVDKYDLKADNGTYSTGSKDESGAEVVLPWIAAIFVKNDTSNVFDYNCDGIIIDERTVLTAGRCVTAPLEADNVIVVLGKKSLQTVGEEERVFRVEHIALHDNFTVNGSEVSNDLAFLTLEEEVEFSGSIQPACFKQVQHDGKDAVTVAWAASGLLTLIHFDQDQSRVCKRRSQENTFCATYGNDVALCPNYGGLYAAKSDNKWCLQGVRTDDTSKRGLCIEKTIHYTSVHDYIQWINEHKDKLSQ